MWAVNLNNGSDMMDMSMFLHFGEREVILFSWWKTGSAIGLIGSMAIIFLLAVLYEALRAFRVWIAVADARTFRARRNESNDEAASTDGLSATRLIFTSSPVSSLKMRVVHAVLHALVSLLGFALMLVVMTFNMWLIFSVVVGVAVGFFVFSGSPSTGEGLNDCC